jgi:hypothetical protein
MNIVSDMIGTLATGSPVIRLVKWFLQRQNTLFASLHFIRNSVSYLSAKWGSSTGSSWDKGSCHPPCPGSKTLAPTV